MEDVDRLPDHLAHLDRQVSFQLLERLFGPRIHVLDFQVEVGIHQVDRRIIDHLLDPGEVAHPRQGGELIRGRAADDPQGFEPKGGDFHVLGREEVEGSSDLTVAHHGQGDGRPDSGTARQRGAAAVVQFADVGDVEQVAEPPGAAIEALPLLEPRGARQPLELVVHPAGFDREDQGILRGVDRPVRRIGPAELLADRIECGADDVLDCLGADDRAERVDHRLGVGIGLRQ